MRPPSRRRQDAVKNPVSARDDGHADRVSESAPAEWLVATPPSRLFACLWGGLAVVDLARLAEAPAWSQTVAIAVLVMACSLRQSRSTALAVAMIGWLVVDGFIQNAYGQLTFGGAGDAARAVLLAGAALVARRLGA